MGGPVFGSQGKTRLVLRRKFGITQLPRTRAPAPPILIIQRMSHSPAAILDPEAIENLRALGDEGDDTFLREIISIYLEDVPQRLADLRSARGSEDRPLYVRSAHTIKGSSANVGALEMRALAEKLEHRAKVEPLSALDAELTEIEAAFTRTRDALRSLIA